MQMHELKRINKLCKAVNSDAKLFKFCANLQKLKRAGWTDERLSDFIIGLNLPLRQHLFITGHFSDLMEIDYSGGCKEDRAIQEPAHIARGKQDQHEAMMRTIPGTAQYNQAMEYKSRIAAEVE